MPILSASQIAGYAQAAGVSGQNVAIATAIALAESSGDTDRISPTQDYGLWQINQVHNPTAQNWKDPAVNAAMMFQVSHGGTNWTPWTTFTSGKYMAHMSAAMGATPASVNTAGNSFGETLTAFQHFANLLSDPHTWLRVGEIVGGMLCIGVAVHMSYNTKIQILNAIAKRLPT